MTRPSLDETRAKLPGLGFAVYALEPGGPVTLEVHASGQVYEFRGATEAEAIERAFPPAVEPEPEGSIFD